MFYSQDSLDLNYGYFIQTNKFKGLNNLILLKQYE